MKRRVKDWLGRSAYGSGVYERFFRNRAVVTLFHRVDDQLAGNPLSCTVDQFTRYCEFFARYFIVVGLGQLLAKIERGEDISRHLVITFDDGYRDNAAVAAHVLGALGLPACFFIATNFIGSRHVPWWDAERGITPEWMSWHDVRSLRDRGFELGAHTMNHVDLGAVSGAEAVAEIAGSGERLSAETQTDVPYFSYPYGRAHQITETNREVVRRVGYRCCLSAYGGSVVPRSDPFDLRRIPISPWYVSPYHFGFEAMVDRDA